MLGNIRLWPKYSKKFKTKYHEQKNNGLLIRTKAKQ